MSPSLRLWTRPILRYTRFEQQKAVAKRVQLDAMEEVLKAKHVTIGKLD
jgi:flagellar biosynthesis/type III secretory pathway chaperone